MSGWACRHQWNDECRKVGVPCQPGMRGCVLCGRVVFAEDIPAEKPRPKTSRKRSAPSSRKR